MMLRAYIGNLDDPTFNWDAPPGGSQANTPWSLGPDFVNASDACSLLWRKRLEKAYVTKDTDWGTIVSRVNKKQLLEFVEELYGGRPGLPWQSEAVQEIIDFVATLDDDCEYGLVCSELW